MVKNGAKVGNNDSWVYESHLKWNKTSRSANTQLNVMKKHNDYETQQSGKQYDIKMTSEGSKINLCSPEAENEIKQGAQ